MKKYLDHEDAVRAARMMAADERQLFRMRRAAAEASGGAKKDRVVLGTYAQHGTSTNLYTPSAFDPEEKKLPIRERKKRTVGVAFQPGKRVTEVVTPSTLLGPAPEPQHWIEIEMLDDDDKPHKDEKYLLLGPDGSTVRSGFLDHKGCAREDGLEALAYKISFPNLDKDVWDLA